MTDQTMKIIGITGGVGAGKSTVLNYMEKHLSACVIQADQVGHQVMEPGGRCYAQVISLFGKNIVKNDNTIDRKAVSDVVFCNEQMRCRLNEIIHPAVKAFILERIEEEQKNGRGLFVVEAALLLEDHYDTICHKIWSIPIRKYGYSALWKAEATAARRQRALLQVRRQRLIFVHMQIMW